MESKKPGSMGLNLQKLQRVFVRRRQTFSLLFFSSATVAILVAYTLPGRYEARAHLLVKVGLEALTVSSVALPEVSPTAVDSYDYLNSQFYILTSDGLLRKVVEQLGVDRVRGVSSPEGRSKSLVSRGLNAIGDARRSLLDALGLLKQLPPTDQAIAKVRNNLSIQAFPNASVLRVTLRWDNPRMAAEIVNTLVELYMAYSVEVQQPKGGFELISEQVAELNRGMAEANEKLTAFKQKHGITSLPNQQGTLFNQLVQLRSQMDDTDAQIAATEGMIKAIEKQLASIAQEVKLTRTEHKNPVYESLRLRQSDLEVELANARARYTEESPVVTSLMKQINVIRDRLNAEETLRLGDVTLGENTTYRTLETARQQDLALLDGLKAKHKTIQEQIDSSTAKLSALSGAETELSRLETESGIASKNYESSRDKYETVWTEKMMDLKKIVSVQTMEKARIPVRPTLSRLLLVTLGILGSVLIGAGGVFASEHLDHTIKDRDDVEKYLHVPIVGVQPRHPVVSNHVWQSSRVPADKAHAGRPEAAEGIKDLYQELRGRLLLSLDGEQGRTIMVAGSVPREGGTTVANNLAIALAGGDGNGCLLIDGNLRTPTLHTLYGLPKEPGLLDLASGAIAPVSLVKPTHIPSLSVVTSGAGNLDPLELYASSAWKDSLAAWRARFRWIILDVAAILPHAEGALLARQADEVILVVSVGTSQRELAITAKERLEASGSKLLGVVLNRRS